MNSCRLFSPSLRTALRTSLVLLALTCTGCEGLVPAAIDSIQSEIAESEREEKEEKKRNEERLRTKECLAILGQKERDLDAGLAELKGLAVLAEEDLKEAKARWKAVKKEILDVPPDCSREVRLSSDPETRSYQEEVFVPRQKAFNALRERLMAAHVPTMRMLIQKGIEGEAPLASRTILFPLYNDEVNTPSQELQELAQAIAAQYDARLLETFKKYGAYGKLGAAGDRVGCVFSAEPWPDDLTTIEPRFQTHFRGKGVVVHILGRLPLAAHHYAGRVAGELKVQVVSDHSGFIDVGRSVSVGRPEVLGDSPYVRAAVELPLPRFDHSRFFFDVRVVLGWQDANGRAHSKVLSQSSFTWQAE